MTQVTQPSVSSNLLYPKQISDQILQAILEGKKLSWDKISGYLDNLIKHLVRFGYENVSGIRQRMVTADVDPAQIEDFESYQRFFPMITITDMCEIGQNNFRLNTSPENLEFRRHDFDTIAKYFLEEGSKKFRRTIIADVNIADARAASLGIASQLFTNRTVNSQVLVNQKPGSHAGNDLLTRIILPAFDLAGIRARRVTENIIQTNPTELGLLLPESKYRVIRNLDPTGYGFVISTDGHAYPGKVLHLGDYAMGIFPNLGYEMPLPILIRTVDQEGRIPLNGLGEPDINYRGRIVLDRLFSAYEHPTPWKLLLDGLAQLLDFVDLGKIDSIRLAEMESFWTTGGNYVFKDHFYQIFDEAAGTAGRREKFTPEDIHRLYSFALKKYYLYSVRLGVPSSTWLLKVGLTKAAQLDAHGLMNSPVELSLGSSEAFVPAKNLRIKYSRDETPFISHNITADFSVENISFPETRSAAISKRVRDVLNGRNLFGPDTEGYLYTVPIVSPGKFISMLEYAQYQSKNPRIPPPDCRFEDIVEIIARLHRKAESELKSTLAGEKSMITLFAQKIKLPISEIIDMLNRAKADFIDKDGQGLLVLLNAAFINPYAPLRQLRAQGRKGLEILKRTTPHSPIFMVTPGNITLYDSFLLFAHFLLANLANQNKKRISIYIRPSESDITFNFLVYHFHKIALELDPQDHKGLRTLFQRAYWDPRHDGDFLQLAMANSEAGIYYGTAKTYMEARFKAAIEVAQREGFSRIQLEKLVAIGGHRKYQYQVKALEEALNQEIDSKVVERVREFISLHNIYPETLNGIVILPDILNVNIEECAASILSQVISTRGADCTNANKVWLPRSIYKIFKQHFHTLAEQLIVGNELNTKTSLALYDKDYLNGTLSIISGRDDTHIITPKLANTGKPAPAPIIPRKNFTGVLVTEIDINDFVNGDPIDQDTYLSHLSKETPLPWLTIVIYDDMDQVYETMNGVLEKYARRSGYPKYLYISLMGDAMTEDVEAQIREKQLTDLIKKGDEAHRQFLYYRPHQGNFFINEFVHLD